MASILFPKCRREGKPYKYIHQLQQAPHQVTSCRTNLAFAERMSVVNKGHPNAYMFFILLQVLATRYQPIPTGIHSVFKLHSSKAKHTFKISHLKSLFKHLYENNSWLFKSNLIKLLIKYLLEVFFLLAFGLMIVVRAVQILLYEGNILAFV